MIRTEGYVIYNNWNQYESILGKIKEIKKETKVQYNYIEDLDFVPSNEKYFMPVNLSIALLILGEIIFFIYILFLYKIISDIKIDILIAGMPTLMLLYQSVKLLLERVITNVTLLLNIARIKNIVIIQVLLMYIVLFVLIIVKRSRKETKKS